MLRLIPALAAVLVVAAACSQGSDVATPHVERAFHVSPDGDDTQDGSAAHPWRTIARAIQEAGPGIAVTLQEGVYRESVVLEGVGGAEGRPFVLRSAAGQRAVLDGSLAAGVGIAVRMPHVVIRGLEIRNYCEDGILVSGRESHDVVIERNVIHHISGSLTGEGESGVRGIRAVGVSDCQIRENTVYMVVGENESFGVLFDLRSAYDKPIRNALIEKNLFYLIDKAAVRIVDNSHPDRCHVLATPAHIRGNICLHIGYVGLEINYVNTAATRPGPLGGQAGAPVYVEDNFVGWCSSYGINPKQSADGVVRHNTIYATQWLGYLQSGEPSYRMRIEGNLLVDNPVGSMVHTVGEDNRFIGNYYRQPPAWPDFFVDRTDGWGTTYTDIGTLHAGSALAGVEAGGVLNSAAEVFRGVERGDFRLVPGCPAAQAAPDGEDFGAREEVLSGVGASRKWSLAMVPHVPEVKGMEIVACSGEDSAPCPIDRDAHYFGRSQAPGAGTASHGLAPHLVDGIRHTTWRVATEGMPASAIVQLPGDEPLRLGAFAISVCHGRYQDQLRCNPRHLVLSARISETDEWQEIGRYARYPRAAGRIFPIEGAPEARQVKLEVLSNHGYDGGVEVGEFRLYQASQPIE